MKKYFFLFLPIIIVVYFLFSHTALAITATNIDLQKNISQRSVCENSAYAKYKDAILPLCKGSCKQFFLSDCIFDSNKIHSSDAYICVEKKLPLLADEILKCNSPEPATDVPPPSLSTGSSLLNIENTNNSDSPQDIVNAPQTTAGTQAGGSYDYTNGDQGDIANSDGCERAANGTCIPGTYFFGSADYNGNADCKQSCRSIYNDCIDNCKVTKDFNRSTEALRDLWTCKDKCTNVYKSAYERVFDGCYEIKRKCSSEISGRRNADGTYACWGGPGDVMGPCFEEVQTRCEVPYGACLNTANIEQNVCLAGCMPEKANMMIPDQNCYDWCGTRNSQCQLSCSDSNIQPDQPITQNSPNIPIQTGLSSLNFKGLARANAEYQKAVADLEKIKQSDERWNAKKNFADEYKAGVEKLIEKLPPSEANEVKKLLDIIKGGSETTRDLATTEIDLKTIYDYGLKKQMDAYGNVPFGADAGNSLNDYAKLREKGVSNKDAGGKAVLDNFGTSAVTSIPIIKVIDVVAATPDNLLDSIGVSENNWSRKATGILAKFSPSGLIRQTTELMLENQSLSDIDDTLRFAMGKVVTAEGVVATTKESVKFTFAVIGAGPVALARGVTDLVGATVFVGEKTVGFVANLFTY